MTLAVLALVLSAAAAHGLERTARPRRSGRPAAPAAGLSATVFVLLFAAMLAATWRPILAALASLGVLACLVAVSNAKHAILREPLVFSDFALAGQVVRYPRLYIAFVGYGRVAAALIVLGAAFGAAWRLEPPLSVRGSIGGWLPSAAIGACVAAVVGIAARGPGRRALHVLARRLMPVPRADGGVSAFGLVASLLLGALRYGDPDQRPAPERLPTRLGAVARTASQAVRPHLVVVQAESFFDARRAMPGIAPSLLAAWDRTRSAALRSGRLLVPAFGANTMRTEHAVLTGVPPTALGFDAFNPYLRAATAATPSLARTLAQQGYRCVCIHPYDFRFFGRDRVLPALGFEALIDERRFDAAARIGPYVGDPAVADCVLEVLAAAREPHFVFAITMENHGPWGEDPVAEYLSHLANTDRMIGRLAEGLGAVERPSVLCVFGDHRPPIDAAAGPDGDVSTDYLVWRATSARGRRQDLAPHALGHAILAAAGLQVRAATSESV